MSSDRPPSSPSLPAGSSRSLTIPSGIYHAMIAHCRREAPLEACGFLGGIQPVVSLFLPLRNAAASETRYSVDPLDLFEADKTLRAHRVQILAIYHSHPKSPAEPSKTDLRENYHEATPHIIVSLPGETPEVRIWRLDADTGVELEWSVVMTPDGTP